MPASRVLHSAGIAPKRSDTTPPRASSPEGGGQFEALLEHSAGGPTKGSNHDSQREEQRKDNAAAAAVPGLLAHLLSGPPDVGHGGQATPESGHRSSGIVYLESGPGPRGDGQAAAKSDKLVSPLEHRSEHLRPELAPAPARTTPGEIAAAIPPKAAAANPEGPSHHVVPPAPGSRTGRPQRGALDPASPDGPRVTPAAGPSIEPNAGASAPTPAPLLSDGVAIRRARGHRYAPPPIGTERQPSPPRGGTGLGRPSGWAPSGPSGAARSRVPEPALAALAPVRRAPIGPDSVNVTSAKGAPSAPAPGFVGANEALVVALSSPQLLADGSRSIEIELTPAELGQVTAHVNVRRGEVTVALVAETEVGQQAIEENLDQLRTRLGGPGTSISLSIRRKGAASTAHAKPAPTAPTVGRRSGSIDLVL